MPENRADSRSEEVGVLPRRHVAAVRSSKDLEKKACFTSVCELRQFFSKARG